MPAVHSVQQAVLAITFGTGLWERLRMSLFPWLSSPMEVMEHPRQVHRILGVKMMGNEARLAPQLPQVIVNLEGRVMCQQAEKIKAV